jgi:hypothetical protein
MLGEAVVGERRVGSGAQSYFRSGPYSALVVADAHGRYFEAARNGRLFTTTVKAVTIATTHNTPIAAATATPILGLLNPVGNTKAAVLLRIAFGTTSGTPAGGQAILNFISGVGQSITGAAAGSIFSHTLPGSASPQASTMRPYNNTALTGLSPAVGNELLLIGAASAAAAAGNGGPSIAGEDLGGSIIVQPNSLLALMAGTGAGTSWIVNASLTWEEIDWPI